MLEQEEPSPPPRHLCFLVFPPPPPPLFTQKYQPAYSPSRYGNPPSPEPVFSTVIAPKILRKFALARCAAQEEARGVPGLNLLSQKWNPLSP